MACIVERKNKKGSNFYLAIGRRINGKVKVDFLPLGTKRPWPKSQGWKSLSQEPVPQRLRVIIEEEES